MDTFHPKTPPSPSIIPPSPGWLEAINTALIKSLLRIAFKPWIGPLLSATWQRRLVAALSKTMPAVSAHIQTMPRQDALPAIEMVSSIPLADTDINAGVILYVHGGAFCLGSASSHRSLTTRLAHASGMPVYVVDYRLAPEHPYPAGLDDIQAAYDYLLRQGYSADNIVIGGDSAGGLLALSLALRLRAAGAPLPAGLLLLSPMTDPLSQGDTHRSLAKADPMITTAWLNMGWRFYQCPAGTPETNPLTHDLSGLPPMLVQAGSEEVLLSDIKALVARAQQHGVACHMELQMGVWHVYQLQAFFLQSARSAIERLGQQARLWVKAS